MGGACVAQFSFALRRLNTVPSLGASHSVSIRLVNQVPRIYFRNRLTRNKICLWQPCLLTDRDEMIDLNRGPAIDGSFG